MGRGKLVLPDTWNRLKKGYCNILYYNTVYHDAVEFWIVSTNNKIWNWNKNREIEKWEDFNFGGLPSAGKMCNFSVCLQLVQIQSINIHVWKCHEPTTRKRKNRYGENVCHLAPMPLRELESIHTARAAVDTGLNSPKIQPYCNILYYFRRDLAFCPNSRCNIVYYILSSGLNMTLNILPRPFTSVYDFKSVHTVQQVH